MFGEVSPNMLREHSALISNAMSCDKYLKAKISSAHNPLATVSRRAARLFALPLGVATREVLSMEPGGQRGETRKEGRKDKTYFQLFVFAFVYVYHGGESICGAGWYSCPAGLGSHSKMHDVLAAATDLLFSSP